MGNNHYLSEPLSSFAAKNGFLLTWFLNQSTVTSLLDLFLVQIDSRGWIYDGISFDIASSTAL